MSPSDPIARDLLKKINSSKKSYDVATFLIGNEEVESALVLAAKTVINLSLILDELAAQNDRTQDHVASVLRKYLPTFESDKNTLLGYYDEARRSTLNVDPETARTLVERVGKHIVVIAREVKRLYPETNEVWRFIRRYHRVALAVLAAAALLAAAVKGWEAYRTRRQGLTGEYYSNMHLSGRAMIRIDKKINFTSAPRRWFKEENYSVRWTGFLFVPKEGDYDFITYSDDGVRLFIDEKPVIDNWTRHSLTKNQGTIHLTAGTHPIRLEYFQFVGVGGMRLLWKEEPHLAPTVVSAMNLFPNQDAIRR